MPNNILKHTNQYEKLSNLILNSSKLRKIKLNMLKTQQIQAAPDTFEVTLQVTVQFS